MKLTNAIRVIAPLFPLIFSMSVFASECNDNAPLADPENIENGYFNLDNHSITGSDRAKLEKLAVKLRGHWQGIELVKTCNGHFKSPDEDRQRYQVRAEVSRHATGAIRVQAEKERESDRVLQLDTMFISPETDAEYGRLQGWHTLDFIDNNTVIFSEKSRVASGIKHKRQFGWPSVFSGANGVFAPLAPTAIGNSRLLHVVQKIQLSGNKLTVDRKLYVNGYFLEQNGWILER